MSVVARFGVCLVLVELICKFDGYSCFRNLCCFSRFYSDFCCSRYCRVVNGRDTPRRVVGSPLSLVELRAFRARRGS
jgi:hypothetical protein